MHATQSLAGKIPFSMLEPEFNPNSYAGRFREFQKTCNPFLSFYTNKKIDVMRQKLKDQEQAELEQEKKTGSRQVPLTKEQIKEIRRCQTVVKTAIHPDTGDYIPWVMRVSSFLPTNIPIAFGFIIAAPTPFNTIFWQWINQTYNALFNYGNRNASSPYGVSDILKSYGIAASSSVAVALGIRHLLAPYTRNAVGAKLILFNSISSFFACSTAGFLNAWFMRRTELTKGIDVTDETGKSYGKSKLTAKRAVLQTAISRYVLAIPIFLPPVLLFAIEKARMMPGNFYAKTLLEVSLIATELYVAVPLGIALYPQSGKILSKDLEPEFQNIKNENGQIIREFIFNKGL